MGIPGNISFGLTPNLQYGRFNSQFQQMVRGMGAARVPRTNMPRDILPGSFSRSLRAHTGDINNFGVAVASAGERFLAWSIGARVIIGIQQAFQNTAKIMVDFQKRLIDVRKVMDDLDNQLKKAGIANFGKEFIQVGIDMSASLDSVMESGQLFAEQGHDVLKTIRLTSEAMLTMRTSTMSAVKATEFLTGLMYQFDMVDDMKKLSKELDGVNTVANKFAVREEDIAEALSKSGAAARVAGMDMAQFTAVVTALQQSTREGGNIIGTFLKTFLQRTQRENAMKLFEDLGVRTRESNGEFRNSFEVLRDLSVIWPALTDSQRASLSTVAGGMRQYSRFVALMERFSTATSALSSYYDSANSRQKEFAQVSNTIDASLQRLSNTWVKVIDAFANDKFKRGVAEIIDSLTALMDKLTQTVGVFQVSPIGALSSMMPLLLGILGKQIKPAIQANIKSFGISMGARWGSLTGKTDNPPPGGFPPATSHLPLAYRSYYYGLGGETSKLEPKGGEQQGLAMGFGSRNLQEGFRGYSALGGISKFTEEAKQSFVDMSQLLKENKFFQKYPRIGTDEDIFQNLQLSKAARLKNLSGFIKFQEEIGKTTYITEPMSKIIKKINDQIQGEGKGFGKGGEVAVAFGQLSNEINKQLAIHPEIRIELQRMANIFRESSDSMSQAASLFVREVGIKGLREKNKTGGVFQVPGIKELLPIEVFKAVAKRARKGGGYPVSEVEEQYLAARQQNEVAKNMGKFREAMSKSVPDIKKEIAEINTTLGTQLIDEKTQTQLKQRLMELNYELSIQDKVTKALADRTKKLSVEEFNRLKSIRTTEKLYKQEVGGKNVGKILMEAMPFTTREKVPGTRKEESVLGLYAKHRKKTGLAIKDREQLKSFWGPEYDQDYSRMLMGMGRDVSDFLKQKSKPLYGEKLKKEVMSYIRSPKKIGQQGIIGQYFGSKFEELSQSTEKTILEMLAEKVKEYDPEVQKFIKKSVKALRGVKSQQGFTKLEKSLGKSAITQYKKMVGEQPWTIPSSVLPGEDVLKPIIMRSSTFRELVKSKVGEYRHKPQAINKNLGRDFLIEFNNLRNQLQQSQYDFLEPFVVGSKNMREFIANKLEEFKTSPQLIKKQLGASVFNEYNKFLGENKKKATDFIQKTITTIAEEQYDKFFSEYSKIKDPSGKRLYKGKIIDQMVGENVPIPRDLLGPRYKKLQSLLYSAYDLEGMKKLSTAREKMKLYQELGEPETFKGGKLNKNVSKGLVKAIRVAGVDVTTTGADLKKAVFLLRDSLLKEVKELMTALQISFDEAQMLIHLGVIPPAKTSGKPQYEMLGPGVNKQPLTTMFPFTSFQKAAEKRERASAWVYNNLGGKGAAPTLVGGKFGLANIVNSEIFDPFIAGAVATGGAVKGVANVFSKSSMKFLVASTIFDVIARKYTENARKIDSAERTVNQSVVLFIDDILQPATMMASMAMWVGGTTGGVMIAIGVLKGLYDWINRIGEERNAIAIKNKEAKQQQSTKNEIERLGQEFSIAVRSAEFGNWGDLLKTKLFSSNLREKFARGIAGVDEEYLMAIEESARNTFFESQEVISGILKNIGKEGPTTDQILEIKKNMKKMESVLDKSLSDTTKQSLNNVTSFFQSVVTDVDEIFDIVRKQMAPSFESLSIAFQESKKSIENSINFALETTNMLSEISGTKFIGRNRELLYQRATETPPMRSDLSLYRPTPTIGNDLQKIWEQFETGIGRNMVGGLNFEKASYKLLNIIKHNHVIDEQIRANVRKLGSDIRAGGMTGYYTGESSKEELENYKQMRISVIKINEDLLKQKIPITKREIGTQEFDTGQTNLYGMVQILDKKLAEYIELDKQLGKSNDEVSQTIKNDVDEMEMLMLTLKMLSSATEESTDTLGSFTKELSDSFVRKLGKTQNEANEQARNIINNMMIGETVTDGDDLSKKIKAKKIPSVIENIGEKGKKINDSLMALEVQDVEYMKTKLSNYKSIILTEKDLMADYYSNSISASNKIIPVVDQMNMRIASDLNKYLLNLYENQKAIGTKLKDPQIDKDEISLLKNKQVANQAIIESTKGLIEFLRFQGSETMRTAAAIEGLNKRLAASVSGIESFYNTWSDFSSVMGGNSDKVIQIEKERFNELSNVYKKDMENRVGLLKSQQGAGIEQNPFMAIQRIQELKQANALIEKNIIGNVEIPKLEQDRAEETLKTNVDQISVLEGIYKTAQDTLINDINLYKIMKRSTDLQMKTIDVLMVGTSREKMKALFSMVISQGLVNKYNQLPQNQKGNYAKNLATTFGVIGSVFGRETSQFAYDYMKEQTDLETVLRGFVNPKIGTLSTQIEEQLRKQRKALLVLPETIEKGAEQFVTSTSSASKALNSLVDVIKNTENGLKEWVSGLLGINTDVTSGKGVEIKQEINNTFTGPIGGVSHDVSGKIVDSVGVGLRMIDNLMQKAKETAILYGPPNPRNVVLMKGNK